MTQILIDSDVLIDYLRGIPVTIALLQHLEAQGETLCTCDIVIAEIETGLSIEQSAKIQPIVDALHLLERDSTAARQAGRWRHAYARRGITLSLADTLIAATAYSHGATLLTRNLSHYPMPELVLYQHPLERQRR